jgi:hypothetical protein
MRSKVNIGQSNTLVVTITDAVGGVTTITETFTADYDGLLFMDESNNYLSTDLGELLRYLDFGTLIAGYSSVAKQVQVFNKTGYAVSNAVMIGPGNINTAGTASIKLCATDSFATSSDTLTLSDLNPGEKTSFYVRVESTNKNISGDYIFNISVAAKENK